MIRIRLNGAAEEVEEVAEKLKQWSALEVSSTSRPYRDRDQSGNVRVYIDAEPVAKGADDGDRNRRS